MENFRPILVFAVTNINKLTVAGYKLHLKKNFNCNWHPKNSKRYLLAVVLVHLNLFLALLRCWFLMVVGKERGRGVEMSS
jgi:hypothetical protein